jgi:NADH-quinone oxidoreductase subunit G
VLIDTLPNRLTKQAEVFLPGASWVEKAGCFVNADERIQAFEQAIPPVGLSRSEAQIALDVLAILSGEAEAGDTTGTITEYPDAMPGQVPTAMEVAAPIGERYNAAMIRQRMAAEYPALRPFVDEIHTPTVVVRQEADMEMVEL